MASATPPLFLSPIRQTPPSSSSVLISALVLEAGIVVGRARGDGSGQQHQRKQGCAAARIHGRGRARSGLGNDAASPLSLSVLSLRRL